MSPGGSDGTPALVSLEAIREAAERIEGIPVRTPLLRSPELSEEVGTEVRLKCESLQRAGAFKIRGAYHFISRLDPGALESGVITYSSGNHAQAVALAARLRGARAVVVMPTTAPAVKVEGARRLGAEVVFEGTTSLERQERALALAEAEGYTVVPPFDHPDIVAGQGTAGLEIAAEWPEVGTVLVPVGGGGLLSGCAAALKELASEDGRDPPRIVGVEPEGAASLRAALDAGEPVTLPSVETIADGLAPVRTGDLTFAHARAFVDDVVTVADGAIRDATRFLVSRQKLVVEYSGAATVAALLSGAAGPLDGGVAAVLSGGNLDPSLLGEILG